MKVLDFIRGLVRPVVQFALTGAVIWMAVRLVLEFADAEMAKYIVFGVVGAGLALLGSYAGERSQRHKQ